MRLTLRLSPLLRPYRPAPQRWVWACLCAMWWPAGLSWAQGVVLQPSERLVERLEGSALRAAPSFVAGERISGTTAGTTVVEGQAELRRHDTVIRADRLEHERESDTVTARGAVRINRMGDVFEGPALTLELDTSVGEFLQPRFEFLQQDGRGDASRIEFQGEDRVVAHDVRYSTCPRPLLGDWTPDWMLTASRIEFDNAEDTGTAIHGVLSFKGVPLLAAPWISFPLSDRRKTGLLSPTFNIDNQSGVELTLPYYLNLAPNRDATLFPTFMSERGLDLGAEYRYLQPNYGGTWSGAFMADDPLRQRDRWRAAIEHAHAWDGGGARRPLALRARIHRVSDDDYWRDFPRSGSTFTQRLLPSELVFSSGWGAWSWSAGAHTWQTLQDLNAPIVAPYDRFQLAAQRAPWAVPLGAGRWQAHVSADLTRFDSPDVAQQTNGRNGTRSLAIARLERRWQAPGWFVAPAVQLHARHYQFDTALPSGRDQVGLLLPTVSVDTGLVLERHSTWWGRAITQTLEPRVFYTHTPFREQQQLPTYDTAIHDFNLATVFLSSPYSGHDRIADLSAVTWGLTSRLLDRASGVELGHIGVAQRRRLRQQWVSLGEAAAGERDSDFLISGALNWSPPWSLNSTIQYSSQQGESVRTTVGVRYQPGEFRVINAAYRLQRNITPYSEQFDLSWQWPLSDLWARRSGAPRCARSQGPGAWYSVGRINYSLPESRIVDLVAGVEFNAGCWIGRFVVERLQQSRTQANQRLLFQIELAGFSRIGSNPLQTLRDNIPRYQYLREDINPPSRFERYE